MFQAIGEAVSALFVTMLVLIVIFVPLGLWKLIEIIVWLFTHIRVVAA